MDALADSLAGKVLYAAPSLSDPNFARSVVLVVQHTRMRDGDAAEPALWTPGGGVEGVPGALGLVLNRGSGARVADVLAQAQGLNPEAVACGVDAELFHGGPCEGPLMVLHGGVADPGLEETRVLEGVTFSSDRDAIRPVLAGAVRPARFFAGYAGWGPGQLESEIEDGGWVLGTLDAEVLFDAGVDPWARLLGGSAQGSVLDGVNPDILPEDPLRN